MHPDNRKLLLACILVALGMAFVTQISLGRAYHAEKGVQRPETAKEKNMADAVRISARLYVALRRP